MIDQSKKMFFHGFVAVAASVVVSGGVWAQDFAELNTQVAMQAINDYRSDNETRILKDFVSLLSIPNVAINLADMSKNADHITNLGITGIQNAAIERRRRTVYLC